MLTASKCVNGAKSVFQKCVDETVDQLQRIKLTEDKQKIPQLCW
jgi:hypothetical protein